MSEKSAFPRTGLYALVADHPALLVSLIYLLASAIGMLFSWSYLWQFGIDFFDYAQIGDFLLASLKEPMTWGVAVLALLLVWVDNIMSVRWGRRERGGWLRWYGTEKYRVMNYLTGVLLVVIFIWLHAYHKAQRTLRGAVPTVEIRLVERDVRFNRVILGTTANYIFTFDPVASDVAVFPAQSLEMIRFDLPDRSDPGKD